MEQDQRYIHVWTNCAYVDGSYYEMLEKKTISEQKASEEQLQSLKDHFSRRKAA